MDGKQEKPVFIKIDGEILEDSLGHSSYINNNSENNENKPEAKDCNQENSRVEVEEYVNVKQEVVDPVTEAIECDKQNIRVDEEECVQTNDGEYNVKIEVGPTTEISGERSVLEFSEFKCNVCDKAFTRRANLKKHMLTHTAEKNDQCTKKT